tara:strand:- start:1025 stop:1534 length:510 start_codon:yes stop_codon:yes gene_type:complete
MASILKVNTIQDATNSNTALSIDASGRVKTPNVINFNVTGSGAWKDHGSSDTTYFITSNQAVDIITNVGSCYDASTGRFTVPSGMDGLYQFNCHLYTNETGDSANVMKIYKNGSNWNDSFFLTANADDYSDNSLTVTWCMPLVATDYVNVIVREDIYGHHSFWNGYFVG